MVSVGTSDIAHIGSAIDITARGTGAVVAIVTVAVILLTASVPLGLVVVLGVPVLMAVRRPADPAAAPPPAGATATRQGELTTRAADIVAGLRVLRGIGGEPMVVRPLPRPSPSGCAPAGVRVARVESLLEAAAGPAARRCSWCW